MPHALFPYNTYTAKRDPDNGPYRRGYYHAIANHAHSTPVELVDVYTCSSPHQPFDPRPARAIYVTAYPALEYMIFTPALNKRITLLIIVTVNVGCGTNAAKDIK